MNITMEDIQRFMVGSIGIALIVAMATFMREALLGDEQPKKTVRVVPGDAASAIHEVLSTNGYVYIAVGEGCSYCPIAYSMVELAGIPVRKIVDIRNLRDEDEVWKFARTVGISSAPALLLVEDGRVVRVIEFSGDVEKDREEIKREKAYLGAAF
ncbi:hypothetical thioredoxin [Alphaspiravirus yamagawaense]|uniref:Hypothetical thioredoxin n=1 Tax=Alphaspiravirus yamagawaense TaxID=1157339 RepID=J7Q202_9VIRU|nr:hypothetical thioredoxin [Aeropyrum coil-shaped virus]CCG27825.1 hypothetical thioredoxin [Aeropyrum coil-shaped virus]